MHTSNTLLSSGCFFINSSFHHQGWTHVASVLGVLGVRTSSIILPKQTRCLPSCWKAHASFGFHLAHCNRMLDNGRNMPWSQQATFLYCRSEQWVHTAPYWSHGTLLGLSIMLDLNHSLQQNEEQDRLWLQPNSCFHGRAELHMSPAVICMLKRAANYIAPAWAR